MEEGCRDGALKEKDREEEDEGKEEERLGAKRRRRGRRGWGTKKDQGFFVQEVVAGIKDKVSRNDGEKNDVERPVEQSFLRSWDCSQIENEEEEESWRERDQMAPRRDEEQKLEEFLEQRRMEGWKEAPGSFRLCEEYLSKWCMNGCHKVKG